MGWGDELMAAGQAKRLHEKTGKPVAITDAAGRIRWHDAWAGLHFIVDPARYVPRDRVYLRNGRDCRPYFQGMLGTEKRWRWTEYRAAAAPPVLALTAAERKLGQELRASLGDYVVVEPHGFAPKTANAKWGAERFQALVDQCPDTIFVQVGDARAATLTGVHRVVTRNFREAAGVLAGAAAHVNHDSGLVHAARALGVPSVVIFGGCTSVDCLGYPENVNLVDRSRETPCGRVEPCAHCARAMEAITPAAVAVALTVLRERSAKHAEAHA